MRGMRDKSARENGYRHHNAPLYGPIGLAGNLSRLLRSDTGGIYVGLLRSRPRGNHSIKLSCHKLLFFNEGRTDTLYERIDEPDDAMGDVEEKNRASGIGSVIISNYTGADTPPERVGRGRRWKASERKKRFGMVILISCSRGRGNGGFLPKSKRQGWRTTDLTSSISSRAMLPPEKS